MKTRFKKFSCLVSFLLVALIILLIPTSVLASPTPIRQIAIPRAIDSNYTHPGWAHSALSFNNGWSLTASSSHLFFYAFSFEGYSGKASYCINPGVHLTIDTTDLDENPDYFTNYPSGINSLLTGAEMEKLLSLVLTYGYGENINDKWDSGNAAHKAEMSELFATQFLIYEIIVGERAADFGYVAPPAGNNQVLEIISPYNPIRSDILGYYASIVADVNAYFAYPSFMSPTNISLTPQKLVYDGTVWTTTLTDTNNTLSKFTFSSSNPDVSFAVAGNELTISSPIYLTDDLLITASKSERLATVVYSNGTPQAGQQDQLTAGTDTVEEILAYLSVSTSSGSLVVKKVLEQPIPGDGDSTVFQVKVKGNDDYLSFDLVSNEYIYTGVAPSESDATVVEISVNDPATLVGLPLDVEYTVEELPATDYTVAYSDDNITLTLVTNTGEITITNTGDAPAPVPPTTTRPPRDTTTEPPETTTIPEETTTAPTETTTEPEETTEPTETTTEPEEVTEATTQPAPYISGGTDPYVPPAPTTPGNTLIADGDEWVELDADGTPIGTWTWDDEEEEWIYEDIPLGALPPTGYYGISSYVFLVLLLLIAGIGLLISPARKSRQ